MTSDAICCAAGQTPPATCLIARTPPRGRFITTEYREQVQRVLSSALAGGQGTDNFIFPLFTRQGERVEVLLNATPRVDETGAVVGVLGVGQDITKIAKAQNELRQVATDLKQVIETANAPSEFRSTGD